VEVHSFTPSHTPRSMKCDSWASFLACTFVSPCFSHKPKAKVVTIQASRVVIEQIFHSSHTFFSKSLDSPFTREFLDDV